MKSRLLLVIAALCSVAPGYAGAQTVIDTRGAGSVSTTWANAQVTGQAFTAPTDNVMLSGSLWLSAAFSASTDFRAVLRAWSGNVEDGNMHSGSVSGPVLFQSAVTTAFDVGPTRFDFTLPSVALQAGASYAFFAEAVQGNLFGYNTNISNVYAGGNGVYGQTPDPDAEMFYDASFVATFATTVPEPASMLLLATGLIGVLGVVRRRSA